MASLLRSVCLVKASAVAVRRAAPPITNAVRNHWNYQYKPGPYPRTLEERANAAKRYGLSLEEYEPYPEELGHGDYPKLPDVGSDSKDINYPYDCPELKRNFNEVMHVRQDIFGEDRFDPAQRHIISVGEQWCWFFATIIGAYTIYTFLDEYKMGRPVTAKHMPGKDLKHYEFGS